MCGDVVKSGDLCGCGMSNLQSKNESLQRQAQSVICFLKSTDEERKKKCLKRGRRDQIKAWILTVKRTFYTFPRLCGAKPNRTFCKRSSTPPHARPKPLLGNEAVRQLLETSTSYFRESPSYFVSKQECFREPTAGSRAW